ncbi:MAG: tRNA lysidine(34) synthetase TilS, partial [Candidatus Methylomirabilales bacterium]
AVPAPIRRRVLLRALRADLSPGSRVRLEHVLAVEALLEPGGERGAVRLPVGREARIQDERLVIGPPGSGRADSPPPPVTLPLAGEARWGSFHATVALGRKVAEVSTPEARGGRACFRVTLDADRLHPPLTLRAWQPGDAYRPTGAPGRRKLQDLFTDAKVPRGRRRRVPVLADTAGVVWVAGFRPDARAAATSATTRPLTLQLLEEPPDAL